LEVFSIKKIYLTPASLEDTESTEKNLIKVKIKTKNTFLD